ncbi:hypothetical protein ACU8L2_31930 (plasmid) [Rhizobium leguminosarum]
MSKIDCVFEAEWPINPEGPWPYRTFSEAFLKRAFFSALPLKTGTSAVVVRKALKVFLKRVLPNYRKLTVASDTLEAPDQDQLLVRAICDHPRARSRIVELELQKERDPPRFGRMQPNVARTRINQDIASLLWGVLFADTENIAVRDWIFSLCDVATGSGERYFLTAARLRDAGSSDQWPCDARGELFTQIVTLMAAKLSVEDALALFNEAAAHGNEYFLYLETSAAIESLPVARHQLAPPHLDDAVAPPSVPTALPVSEKSEALLDALDQSEADLKLAESELASGAIQDLSKLSELNERDYEEAIRSVTQVRAARAAVGARRGQCSLETERLIAESAQQVGLVASGIVLPAGSASERLRQADRVRSLVEASAAAGLAVVDAWRGDLGSQVATIDDLGQLAILAADHLRKQQLRARFGYDIKEYCRGQPSGSLIQGWLQELRTEEIEALGAAFPADNLLPLRSIVLRLMSEKNGDEAASKLRLLVGEETTVRRDLLRFLDSATSAFDSEPIVRRMIALEKFRDAVFFGPLALVSDPASGLSDVNVVGRTVHELSLMLSEHLDIVAGADDLRSLLAGPTSTQDTFGALKEFINTPIMMTGIYRKLREAARDVIFAPLCLPSRPNLTVMASTLADVKSGKAAEEIIASVSRTLGGRVEARHRSQLERYVSQGSVLLERLTSEGAGGGKPGSRHVAFRGKLERLLAQLRRSGAAGSIEWFEANIHLMLTGMESPPEYLTLIGDAEPFFTREWDESDSQWARAYLELAEFHDDRRLNGLEVTSALLWWISRDRLPTKDEIITHLIVNGRYASALSTIQEFGDQVNVQSLLGLLGKETSGQKSEALERLRILRDLAKELDFADGSILDQVQEAIENLDFDAARERGDLAELMLYEAQSSDRPALESESDTGRRGQLTKLLLKAGVTVFEDRSPIYDLERQWAEELKRRAPNRTHILLAEGTFASASNVISEVAAEMAVFEDLTKDPDTWLQSRTADLFSEMLEPSASKLRTWIESSPAFSLAAKNALPILIRWYLKFFIEIARTLNANGDEEPDGVLEHVYEISDIIRSSGEPINCMARLTEIGEVFADEPAENPTVLDADAIDVDELEEAFPAKGTSEEVSSDRALASSLMSKVGEAMIGQEWEKILELAAANPTVEHSHYFAELARLIIAADEGLTLQISSEVAEVSSMLSSDELRFIPRAIRAEIAYRIVCVALELRRKPDGGLWADVLANRPDAVKNISQLSGNGRRAVENLLKGSLGMELAEKLWDAATNTGEPQAIRTPLLFFLYERSSELVLKLAQKHEPPLRDKLEQLFEIRSVAVTRSDLVPVAQSLAAQTAQQAKAGPFRNFIRGLPSAHTVEQPRLIATTDEQISFRLENGRPTRVELPITIEPRGLVPEVLSVTLFQEDDVTFADGSRRMDLTKQPVYFAADYLVSIKLGASWAKADSEPIRELLRMRVGAKTLTGDVIHTDIACQVFRQDRGRGDGHSLDNSSLWEIYPGVGSQPAKDEEFIGRVTEIEQLRTVLVSSRKPSPVLLTGMRRVGKTSLLQEFHKSYKQPNGPNAVTVYLSIAEKRSAFMDKNKDVSGTMFSAIVNVLAKRVSLGDKNHDVVAKLQSKLNCEWQAVRVKLQECYDKDSLAESLIYLSEKLLEWLGGASKRIIYLVDEAETLVVPYQAGGTKRTELEQFLQSLREVSQASENIGIVLSGSNHIDVFAREYKNAFFGSCFSINLKGLEDFGDCSHIIAPQRVKPFVQFDQAAIEYAAQISAGMPLFMWQLGAATAALVRSGRATKTDVRRAVQALVLDDGVTLPFKAYEILEPLEHMLGLRPEPEPDLLWMLLYRVANSTSLVAPEANVGFILDQTLLGVRDKDVWRQHLVDLAEIGILEIPKPGEYRFKIPIFAEGFRAAKQWGEFTLRHQRATI